MRLKTAIDLHSTVRLALLPAEENTPLLHDLDKCLSGNGDDNPVPATPYLSPGLVSHCRRPRREHSRGQIHDD